MTNKIFWFRLYTSMKNERFNRALLDVQKKDGKVVAFTISRKFWGNGNNKNGGRLLRVTKNGDKMCCLGFYSLACGISKKAIRGKQMPTELAPNLKQEMLLAWLRGNSNLKKNGSKFLNNQDWLAMVNDTNFGYYKTVERKEAFIKKVFAANKIQVKFVD